MMLRANNITKKISSYGAHGNSGPNGIPIGQWGRTVTSEEQDDRLRIMRQNGMSIRQISYLTGLPRSTVGDALRRKHDSLPEPAPFYRLVEF